MPKMLTFCIDKAVNPDWNPTDPSGSLYLTRMADLNALHRYPYYRQWHVPGTSHSVYAGNSGRGMASAPLDVSHMTEMAHDDQSLRQSKIAAIRRRGAGGLGTGAGGGSQVNMSTLLATGPTLGASVFVDPTNAPSVTLGDSHHQELPAGRAADPTGSSKGLTAGGAAGSGVLSEDLAPDRGVGSGLGESYVDGGRRYSAGVGVGREGEEEEGGVEDGGVLGLLAQIYGRTDGPPVVL